MVFAIGGLAKHEFIIEHQLRQSNLVREVWEKSVVNRTILVGENIVGDPNNKFYHRQSRTQIRSRRYILKSYNFRYNKRCGIKWVGVIVTSIPPEPDEGV